MNHYERQSCLIEPYNGALVDLLISPHEQEHLWNKAASLPRIQLTTRSICDLELLATGGFSPLDRFMNKADYERVLEEMRLANGILYPLPVTLPVSSDVGVKLDSEIALSDQSNNLLAVMRVEEIYEWNREHEASMVYGGNDSRHPLVAEMQSWGSLNVSGPLRVLTLPRHPDFKSLRLTPIQVRNKLEALAHQNVVAFQTRNPLHRVHEELTMRAVRQIDGTLLLHPVVGMTKLGDIDYYTRVRTYKLLADRYYDPKRTVLTLLPLAMRMAGPREAVWHAIIRRNYGANHLIVGRDHASPGNKTNGEPFYGPYEAQEFLERHSEEIGVTPLPFRELQYLPEEESYEEPSRIKGRTALSISGSQLRNDYLQQGQRIPEWFMRPEVAAILEQANPPRHRQGFCIWFTGLSGAGKSTTADILTVRLLEAGRQVTVLDGDVVRVLLSKGLGFSREDRDANIRRIGYVASEIVRHSGAVICAAVSPYRATRNECRNMIGDDHFIEVYVSTPIEICEQRDTKGMYMLARAGKIKSFTGIDDLYEVPLNPEITIETEVNTAEENVQIIIGHLVERGLLQGSDKEDGKRSELVHG